MKISKELFVVSKKWISCYYDSTTCKYIHNPPTNFGFLHPHEENTKADKSRKQTQLQWAYVPNYGTEVFQKDSEWFISEKIYSYDKETSCKITKIDDEYAPRIWTNTPLTGFKIIDTVSRERGNKLFKVLDPRGIEFEITALSLFKIIMNGTVKNGEILDTCVWAGNKNLVIYI